MNKFLASLLETGQADNIKLLKALAGSFNVDYLNCFTPANAWKIVDCGWSGIAQRPYIYIRKVQGRGYVVDAKCIYI